MRPSVQSPRPPESDTPVCLQDLPPSVLLLVATALATPLLKHTFRIPHAYRASHNSLLAASLTCRALRTACFPLAAQVMRSPGLRPLNIADLGESVRELESKVDYLLGEGNDSLRGHVRSLDIEIYAKAHPRLVSKLATLFTSLPHLHFVALKLPSYRVFRDGFISDLRAVMGDGSRLMRGVTELCVDARLIWLVEFVPDVRELVLWGWPSDVDRDGGLTAEETRDGWRTFLARLNAHAPNVHEVEVGGLSIYDVNELFAEEEHGAVALPNPYIPQRIAQDVDQIWEDTEQGEVISGLSGSVRRIIYFDLQEECGSVYIPDTRGGNGEKEEGLWVDAGPAVVLSCLKTRSRV
ncbi:hypothetical protein RhiJN_27372 [Ceratobasidium sp. AG-Ba]|nr:hypothetical protein RhiJN_27372 [Ceratobasidium sp. AG-Ba]